MDAIATLHTGDVLEFVRGQRAQVPGQQSILNAAIAGSWCRCAIEYSLDPGRQHYAPAIMDAPTLNRRRSQYADLIRIAAAEIDWLYQCIGESGYAVVLTDASGVVLYERTDPTLTDVFHAAGLMAGADWSERQEGTNGIGTCIAEDRPMIVHREEHFRSCHIGLSCSGAPIRDPSGVLVAVLDASTLSSRDSRTSVAQIMALVSLSARLIEKCLFLQQFQKEVVFRFHARPEFVNLEHSGTIALAHDATVLAVDETALWLLRAKNRAALVGRRIDDIFEVGADALVDSAGIDAAGATQTALQPVRDVLLGRRFFSSLDHGAADTRSRAAVECVWVWNGLGAWGSGQGSKAADIEPLEPNLARAPRPEPSALPSPTSSHRVLEFVPPTGGNSPLTLDELAGEDPQMRRNIRSARRIAASRVPVMIQGPTGAGKEVFARALHAASDRATRPFVALNCAAIPESLIESELFGYRSGAFTGARKEGMKGKILQSSGGTLFLDEIGDMQLSLQTRLLRVLEEQEVMPLGTETALKVDLRVICASHQNLRAMIARGEFREDLYYRLNGITLELPPLALRADKERLIREFLAAGAGDGQPAAIEMEAFQQLLDYGWPGNVRELRNVIRTALAICDGGVVRLEDLPSEVRGCEVRQNEECKSIPAPCVRQASAERETVMKCIRECEGNMSRVAERLGMSRNTLYRRCKRLGIPLQHSRGPEGDWLPKRNAGCRSPSSS